MSASHPAPARGPLPFGVCADVAEWLPLLADRELDPVERARIEQHLAACSSCQHEADRYERLSSALKGWDAGVTSVVVPGARIERSVLSRVAEEAAARRVWRRRSAWTRYGVAASIMAVLASAVALGAGARFGREPVAPASTVAREPLPSPLAEALAALPAPGELGAAEPLVAAAPTVETAPFALPLLPEIDESRSSPAAGGLVAAAETDFGVARLEALRREIDRRSALLGERVRVWIGPTAERPLRFLPERTLRWLEEAGLLRAWAEAAGDRDLGPTASSSEGDVATLPSGLVLGDVLPANLPLDPALLGEAGTALAALPGSTALLDVRWIEEAKWPAAASEPAPRSRAWIDAAEAVRSGRLVLREEAGRDGDVVVALVEPGSSDILLPEGQLLVGGRFDRILAAPVWMPSAATRQPYVLQCTRVAWGPARPSGTAINVSPYLAGPSLRALVRAGADATRVVERVQELVELADPAGWPERRLRGGSLRDAFTALRPWRGSSSALDQVTFADRFEATVATLAPRLEAMGAAGWVASYRDGYGRPLWLGAEFVAGSGPARARLLARQHAASECEAWLLRRRQALAAAVEVEGRATFLSPLEVERAIEREGTALLVHGTIGHEAAERHLFAAPRVASSAAGAAHVLRFHGLEVDGRLRTAGLLQDLWLP